MKAKRKEAEENQKRRKSIGLNWIFIAFIIILTFLLYGNTVFNFYSFDDSFVTKNNEVIKKGMSAIPEIFTSLYSYGENRDELSYGYRPLVKTTFAIEYAIFGQNPFVSHFISVLFYLLMILILYIVLKRIFRNYHLLFPFLVTVLYLAHPIHTEVVASLKNRDEILVFGFGLLALHQSLKFADLRRIKYLFWGVIFFILAFLSKETASLFIFIIPLTLYFFSDLKLKKILYFFLGLLLIGLVAYGIPRLFLADVHREFQYWENPLPFTGTIWTRLGTGLYVLLYYFRLLVFPHPLLHYYGYDMVPITNLANIWVIVSFVFYAAIFIIAIMKLREKHIVSYIILFYLLSIAGFSNVINPVPGIIAERLLFIPSLAFCMIIIYLLFLAFGIKPGKTVAGKSKLVFISFIVFLILIPYSVKTRTRNRDWKTVYSLFNRDIKYLENSVKANDLLASELIRQVNVELQKPVDVTKFLRPTIDRALSHWEKAVEIYPDHYSSWTNMGIVYQRIYKENEKSIQYFNKALKIKPDHAKAIFNMGMAYEELDNLEKAAELYQKCIELEPDVVNPRSRLANVYFRMGRFREALALNEEIMRIDPDNALPYVNLGNYYFNQADTARAISFYEKAAEIGAPPQVSMFLSKFFSDRRNLEKANFYREKVRKLQERK